MISSGFFFAQNTYRDSPKALKNVSYIMPNTSINYNLSTQINPPDGIM
jgi:hypothetical protein